MRIFAQLFELARRVVNSKYGLILVFISLSLLVGLFIVDDYGLSWDEYYDITYGDLTLKAYKGGDDFQRLYANRKYYGPFYWMSVNLISRLVTRIEGSIFVVDVWKYCHFIMFQISVFSFFLLSSRFMSRTLAFLTTLLFSTQPLLFGHAFINPKDIPFMSFFMTSIAVGMIGVDTIKRRMESSPVHSSPKRTQPRVIWESLRGDWTASSTAKKALLLTFTLLLVILSIEFFVLNKVFLPWLQAIVSRAYDGTAEKAIKWLFNLVAQDAYKTPVEMYITKINLAYDWARYLVIIVLLSLSIIIWRSIFLKEREKVPFTIWLRGHYAIILAGILLGLTTSIRVGALFAGVLVSGYFLVKSRRRAISPIILYWVIAVLITFATWPFLWDAPIDRFLESVSTASSFSGYSVLFQGAIFRSQDVPIYYLPFLIIVQFTEPLLILSLIGMVVGIIRFWKMKIDRPGFILLMMWAGLPTILIAGLRIPVYDNFRQLLFTIPPIIVLSGMGLSIIIERIKPWIFKLLVIMLILVPGIVSIVKLHPYEYIFYNSLIGGVDGAQGNYGLDYWCISYKEVMEYVNREAPSNARVVAWGPLQAARTFARSDLIVLSEGEIGSGPDYAIACDAALDNDNYYRGYEVQYEVFRAGAVLGRVKQRPQSSGAE